MGQLVKIKQLVKRRAPPRYHLPITTLSPPYVSPRLTTPSTTPSPPRQHQIISSLNDRPSINPSCHNSIITPLPHTHPFTHPLAPSRPACLDIPGAHICLQDALIRPGRAHLPARVNCPHRGGGVAARGGGRQHQNRRPLHGHLVGPYSPPRGATHPAHLPGTATPEVHRLHPHRAGQWSGGRVVG